LDRSAAESTAVKGRVSRGAGASAATLGGLRNRAVNVPAKHPKSGTAAITTISATTARFDAIGGTYPPCARSIDARRVTSTIQKHGPARLNCSVANHVEAQ